MNVETNLLATSFSIGPIINLKNVPMFSDEYFSFKGAKHTLKITVIDNVGNQSKHELEFFRK
mgnify:CR=1 FL=1